MSAIIGKKVGMTRVFDEDGTSVPVTVVEAKPCTVTAVRDTERDGYSAIQLAGIETEERKLTKAELGHLKKADAAPSRELVEFRDIEVPTATAAGSDSSEGASEGEGEDSGEAPAAGEGSGPKLGEAVTVESFEPGQVVKVSAVSIGKGFQGTVRRHGFGRGPVSHGSRNIRAPGSIGASADPARVFKGQRMPGQMGAHRVTQRGCTVHDVDADNHLLLIKGSIPGARNATVEVRSDGR